MRAARVRRGAWRSLGGAAVRLRRRRLGTSGRATAGAYARGGRLPSRRTDLGANGRVHPGTRAARRRNSRRAVESTMASAPSGALLPSRQTGPGRERPRPPKDSARSQRVAVLAMAGCSCPRVSLAPGGVVDGGVGVVRYVAAVAPWDLSANGHVHPGTRSQRGRRDDVRDRHPPPGARPIARRRRRDGRRAPAGPVDLGGIPWLNEPPACRARGSCSPSPWRRPGQLRFRTRANPPSAVGADR